MTNDSSRESWNISDMVNKTSTEETSPLKVTTTVVMTGSLIIIMLGVGACIQLKELWAHLRRPYGILIGAASQFIVLPLTAFGLGHALQLPPKQAIGMLIMSCCPGGSTSNMFTLWVDGDVPLSLTMTTVNTVLSAGFLPLNLLIYSRSWTNKKAVIPFGNLAQAFAMMLVPAVVGIAVRHWKPKVAMYIIKIGSAAGAVSVVAAMTLTSLLYPFMYYSSWRIYFAVVFLPFISFGFGYATAFIFRMPHFRCRTVAMETGIQNFPFCMTLLSLTFSQSEMGELSLYPLLFGVFILVDSVIATAMYRTGVLMYSKMSKQGEFTPVSIDSNEHHPGATKQTC
ncbi:ileal sodium/bile acid cotransporter-like [Haliotis rubra]|uniref:ileal sodium/bile acid cotransporter-like n=1 Tax=Haliotis rubra TaxID=36100 RepID=UPI001EE58D2F|nr:ileal sodium/bile acid cotransporter-like [Haliotis rubra]